MNFLTPAIHGVAVERIASGGGVEPFRCLHNLLSSQPMAFNVFGPLQLDPGLAVRLLDPVLPGGVAAATVSIEWAPPRSLHLGDATSFDVAVRYVTRDGAAALAGIETKLTEPFSKKSYGIDSSDPRTARYRAVARRSTAWRDPANNDLTNVRWNQVWRNHLLVESIRQHEPGLLGCAVVIHHPLDDRCASAVEEYAGLLANPESDFRAVPLDSLIGCWRSLVDGEVRRLWLDNLADRYLNVELSEDGWTALTGAARPRRRR